MTLTPIGARLTPVTKDGDTTPDLTPRKARGRRLDQIREHLGFSERALEERTGISRATFAKVFAGDETVRPSTLDRVERAIMDLDKELGPPPAPQSAGEDVIQFRISGNFGVDVIVSGPPTELGALEEAVARLVREMRNG